MQCLLACSMDTRVAVSSVLVVCGGMAGTPGLCPRVATIISGPRLIASCLLCGRVSCRACPSAVVRSWQYRQRRFGGPTVSCSLLLARMPVFVPHTPPVTQASQVASTCCEDAAARLTHSTGDRALDWWLLVGHVRQCVGSGVCQGRRRVRRRAQGTIRELLVPVRHWHTGAREGRRPSVTAATGAGPGCWGNRAQTVMAKGTGRLGVCGVSRSCRGGTW